MSGVARELRKVADRLNQRVKELKKELYQSTPEGCESIYLLCELADRLHAAAGRLGASERDSGGSSEAPTVRIRPLHL